jgi:CRP/FNR family transcriptional regulator
VSFEPGRILVNERDPAAHVFNITAGVVKLYKLLVDGRRQIVGFLFAGDLLGLSFGGEYAYSAEAVTPVTACRFARPRLNDLLRQFPAMSERLLGIAVNELGAAQEQMLLLGRKTARERVASFLLSLSRRAARAGLRDDPVSLPMTRADIGDYLGLTIETVSRTLSQLKRDGIVSLPSPSTVRLADREALEEAAEGG